MLHQEKYAFLLPTWTFHLLELPILTNSGSDEVVRNLFLLASKEFFFPQVGLLFRSVTQHKLLGLYEYCKGVNLRIV